MTTYMDVLRAHVAAAEARYLQGGRTLLDDPRPIRDAAAEIEQLRADNAILAAEVRARRELEVRLIDIAAGALVGQTSGSARLACDTARADVGARTDATDASGALARAGGVE